MTCEESVEGVPSCGFVHTKSRVVKRILQLFVLI